MPRIPANRPTPADSPAEPVLDQASPVAVLALDAPPAAVRRDPPAPKPRRQPPAPPPLPAAETTSDTIGQQEIALSLAAEAIFERPENEWQPADHALLRRVAPREKGQTTIQDYRFNLWVQSQVARVRARQAIQARAGSAAERQNAQNRAAADAQKLVIEGEAINRQLADLQGRLSALEQTALASRQVVENYETAVKALQQEPMLPDCVRDGLRALRSKHHAEFGAEAEKLRQRLKVTQQLTRLDVSPPKRSAAGETIADGSGLEQIRLYVSANPTLGPDELSRLGRFFAITDVSCFGGSRSVRIGALKTEAWDQYLVELAAEASEIRLRLAAIEQQERDAQEEVNSLLNFYLR